MPLFSNELKALAVLTDMSEPGASATREQCMTVDHFEYCCARKRDKRGRTYGAKEPVELRFSVRINAAEQSQPFYKSLKMFAPCILSFLFNATFSDTKRMSDYDEALAVEGYMVDIQEDYRSTAPTNPDDEQIILRACMSVRSITYIVNGEQKQLSFHN